MNIANIDKAIAIMRRAQRLDMTFYQDGEGICETEEGLHACGNTACFAGYVAISPEFRADGGEVMLAGMPYFRRSSGPEAIARWLDISVHEASQFVLGIDDFYHPVPFHEVEPHHVIEKLEALKNGN